MDAVKTKFNLYGFDVNRHKYGEISYLYPDINDNAEYKCTKRDFKKLCSYLRTIRYLFQLRSVYNQLGGFQ